GTRRETGGYEDQRALRRRDAVLAVAKEDLPGFGVEGVVAVAARGAVEIRAAFPRAPDVVLLCPQSEIVFEDRGLGSLVTLEGTAVSGPEPSGLEREAAGCLGCGRLVAKDAEAWLGVDESERFDLTAGVEGQSDAGAV